MNLQPKANEAQVAEAGLTSSSQAPARKVFFIPSDMSEETAMKILQSVLFLDRDQEEANLLNNRLTKYDGKSLLCYFGPGGIGKTALLKHFKQLLDNKPLWDCLYLPLKSNETYSASEKELSSESNRTIDSFEQCLQAIEEELQAHDFFSAEEQTLSLVGPERAIAVKQQLEKVLVKGNRKLVIIFDSFNNSTKEWFGQLERQILSPLLTTNKNLLIIFGSRSPVRLNQLELRLLLELIPVKPLDLTEKDLSQVEDYFKALQVVHKIQPNEEQSSDHTASETAQPSAKLLPYRELAQTVFKLTYGYPGALAELLNWLKKKPDDNIADLQTPGCYRTKEKLMNFVLEQYAWLADDKTSKKQEQIKLILREASIFRRFDTDMLQEVLVNLYDEAYSESFQFLKGNGMTTNDLAQEIVRTRLMQWNAFRRGYVIDFSYRAILAQGLQAQNQEAFQKRHYRAIKQYLRLLLLQYNREEEETRAIYVIELCYHIGEAYPVEEAKKKFRELKSYFETGYIPVDNKFDYEIHSPIQLPSQTLVAKAYNEWEENKQLKKEVKEFITQISYF